MHLHIFNITSFKKYVCVLLLGFFRVELGRNLLGIESHLAWAVPGQFTTSDGQFKVDPSYYIQVMRKRLKVVG